MLNFDLSYLAHTASPVSRLSDEETDASSVGADDSQNTSGGSGSLHSGGEEVQSPPLRHHQKKLEVTRPSRHHTSTPQLPEDVDDLDNLPPELEKPGLSYVALISKAILSSPEKRLLLGDIYKCITDNYPYYRFQHDKAWKNSIRHNLSLNECFVKNGRSADGKGNYWAIHPACAEDFKNGDFRRRQARRRAKRCQQQQQQHMHQRGQLESIQSPELSAAGGYGYVPMTQTPSGPSMASSPLVGGGGTASYRSVTSYPYYQPYPTRSHYLHHEAVNHHSQPPAQKYGDTGSSNIYTSHVSNPALYQHQTSSLPTYLPPTGMGMPQTCQRTTAAAPTANVTATQITVAQYNPSAPAQGMPGLPLSTLRDAVSSFANQYSLV